MRHLSRLGQCAMVLYPPLCIGAQRAHLRLAQAGFTVLADLHQHNLGFPAYAYASKPAFWAKRLLWRLALLVAGIWNRDTA